MTMVQPHQVRAALGLLGWPQKTLADAMGQSSRGRVSAYLAGHGRAFNPTFGARLRTALEGQGVEFIPGGARLVNQQQERVA